MFKRHGDILNGLYFLKRLYGFNVQAGVRVRVRGWGMCVCFG